MLRERKTIVKKIEIYRKIQIRNNKSDEMKNSQ